MPAASHPRVGEGARTPIARTRRPRFSERSSRGARAPWLAARGGGLGGGGGHGISPRQARIQADRRPPTACSRTQLRGPRAFRERGPAGPAEPTHRPTRTPNAPPPPVPPPVSATVSATVPPPEEDPRLCNCAHPTSKTPSIAPPPVTHAHAHTRTPFPTIEPPTLPAVYHSAIASPWRGCGGF
jgi:hypothetical protein